MDICSRYRVKQGSLLARVPELRVDQTALIDRVVSKLLELWDLAGEIQCGGNLRTSSAT